MRRTKEAARETRNRILDAAEDVFAERGVGGTALSHIADAAHVTRGAIYWHFRNKGDLLTSMIDRIMLSTEATIAAAETTRERDPLRRIREVLISSLNNAVHNRRAWRVLAVLVTRCEPCDVTEQALERCRTAAHRVFNSLPAALHHAMKQGYLPSDMDVEYASKILRGLWTGLLREWLLDRPVASPNADAERIADTWLDMLRYSPACRAQAGRRGAGED